MEFDSWTTLDLITNTNQNDFHHHANLLSLIKKLSYISWVVSFNHALREGNECANSLTKFGAKNVDSLKMDVSSSSTKYHSVGGYLWGI